MLHPLNTAAADMQAKTRQELEKQVQMLAQMVEEMSMEQVQHPV